MDRLGQKQNRTCCTGPGLYRPIHLLAKDASQFKSSSINPSVRPIQHFVDQCNSSPINPPAIQQMRQSIRQSTRASRGCAREDDDRRHLSARHPLPAPVRSRPSASLSARVSARSPASPLTVRLSAAATVYNPPVQSVPVRLTVRLSISPSDHLVVRLPVSPSVRLSPSTRQPVRQPVCPSVYPPVRQPASLSARPPVRPSVGRSRARLVSRSVERTKGPPSAVAVTVPGRRSRRQHAKSRAMGRRRVPVWPPLVGDCRRPDGALVTRG